MKDKPRKFLKFIIYNSSLVLTNKMTLKQAAPIPGTLSQSIWQKLFDRNKKNLKKNWEGLSFESKNSRHISDRCEGNVTHHAEIATFNGTFSRGLKFSLPDRLP